MYNTILKSSFLSADDVKKISQRRQREPDLQESILKSLDISKFIIFIWSYCMLKFFLVGKLYWKIHRCTYMETTVQERENCFFFEVFVRFFSVQLEGRSAQLDSGSAGEGTLEEFTEWQYFSRSRFESIATILSVVCSVGPLDICNIEKRCAMSGFQLAWVGTILLQSVVLTHLKYATYALKRQVFSWLGWVQCCCSQ